MQDVSKNELNKPKESNNALVETKNALTEIDDLKKLFDTPYIYISENNLLKECNGLNELKKRSKEQDDRRDKLFTELTSLHGLVNGNFLQTIANNTKDSSMLVKIRQDFINEYKCQSTSELMLVDRIVSAYWRGMRYEIYLSRLIEKEPDQFSFDELKVRILKELHKGIEIANRQFETGLTLLRNLKQPKLNIKVTADNAYLAQNQQVINKGESLKPNDLGEIYEATD